MQNENSGQNTRLSSKLTKVSKVFLILFGIPISLTVSVQTHFAVWAILISVALIVFCVYFSYLTLDAFKQGDAIRFVGLFGSETIVERQNILKISRLRSRRNEYFFFTTAAAKFLVIAPLWGAGYDELNKIYTEKN
jgi:hypothetical protein